MQMQCYPPLWLLHSDIGDFSNGVYHAMEIISAEINPDIGLFNTLDILL